MATVVRHGAGRRRGRELAGGVVGALAGGGGGALAGGGGDALVGDWGGALAGVWEGRAWFGRGGGAGTRRAASFLQGIERIDPLRVL